MTSYLFNIAKFILDFTPRILIMPRMIAWMTALLKPLQIIHQDFLSFRTDINEQLSINSQTMLMEYYLNKRYNGGLTGIWIENIIVQFPSVYVGYLFEPGHNVYVGYGESEAIITPDVYVGYLTEQTDSDFDFIIHVPLSIQGTFDEGAMNAFLKKYTFSGKRWQITYY